MRKPIVWLAGAAVAALIVGAAFVLARPGKVELVGTALDDAPGVRDVALVDTTGREVLLGDWKGESVLVFFGYANCPDVCPLTMASLAGTYRDLGEPDDLQVIMVTVDPERDDPERLRSYVRRFHHDFVGLTGTPQQIAEASARFYATAVDRGEGDVAHSSHVTLLDPDGRMRVIYNQDKIEGGGLQRDLETILARGPSW